MNPNIERPRTCLFPQLHAMPADTEPHGFIVGALHAHAGERGSSPPANGLVDLRETIIGDERFGMGMAADRDGTAGVFRFRLIHLAVPIFPAQVEADA